MTRLLRGMKGPYAGAVFVVGERVTFGRASDSDVQILHPEVSRHHAKITVDREGNCVLIDLASDNGTTVNDVRIARHLLLPGDSFCIHKCIFMFDVCDGPVETSPVFCARVHSIESLRQTSVGLTAPRTRPRPFDPLAHRVRAEVEGPLQGSDVVARAEEIKGAVTREIVDVDRVRTLAPRAIDDVAELGAHEIAAVPLSISACDTVVVEPSKLTSALASLDGVPPCVDLGLEAPPHAIPVDGPALASSDDGVPSIVAAGGTLPPIILEGPPPIVRLEGPPLAIRVEGAPVEPLVGDAAASSDMESVSAGARGLVAAAAIEQGAQALAAKWLPPQPDGVLAELALSPDLGGDTPSSAGSPSTGSPPGGSGRTTGHPREDEEPLPPGLQGVPWSKARGRGARPRPAVLQHPWGPSPGRSDSSNSVRADAQASAGRPSPLNLLPLPRPGDARAPAEIHALRHPPGVPQASPSPVSPSYAIPWPDDALPYAPSYEPPMAAVRGARKPGRGNHAPRWQPSGVLHAQDEAPPPLVAPLPADSLEIELDQKVAGAASLTRKDEDDDETTRFRARRAAQRRADSEILSITEKETLIVFGDILDFRTLRARKLQFGGLAAPDEERLLMLQQRLHGSVGEQQVELRYAPRGCTLDVRVVQPEAGSLRSTRVELIDLSAGQARVGRIAVPLRVGDAVWLTVDLSTVHISTRCLVFKSRVAWAQPEDERCGVLFVGAPQLVEDPERLILGTAN